MLILQDKVEKDFLCAFVLMNTEVLFVTFRREHTERIMIICLEYIANN